MKKLTTLLIPFLLLLSSCFHEVNFGYPKCIEFHSDGGTKKIFGDDSFSYMVIYDDTDGDRSEINDDTIITVSYDWLQIEYIRGSESFTITAQPNSTGHKRKLKVEGYSGYEYASIDVIQGY
ncbi:MAG: hypothetical protein K2K84_04605 [Muribaculaceae bacterium]|nr:hypothetical protein [Muribaculaceae bacterium]